MKVILFALGLVILIFGWGCSETSQKEKVSAQSDSNISADSADDSGEGGESVQLGGVSSGTGKGTFETSGGSSDYDAPTMPSDGGAGSSEESEHGETDMASAILSGSTPPSAPSEAGDTADDGDDPGASDEATTEPTDPAEPPDDKEDVQSGQLTAAIWSDLTNYDDFLTFIDRYPEYKSDWKLDLTTRLVLAIKGKDGNPYPNAAVTLKSGVDTVFNGPSSVQGKIYFYPGLPLDELPDKYHVLISTEQGDQSSDIPPVKEDGSLNYFHEISLGHSYTKTAKPKLDLTFLIDTTGSMGDELSYLQAEIKSIVQTVILDTNSDEVRLSVVFYRDRGDQYITNLHDFSTDLDAFEKNLKSTFASGGGDFPESLNEALRETIEGLTWKNDTRARLCFLVADAPPHYYSDEQYTYIEGIEDSVEKGIKIFPIAGSGIDKSTEFLFRHLAAYTQGQYIFLTDDSGVGGSHIEPDITGYQVERLDNLLIRVIKAEMADL